MTNSRAAQLNKRSAAALAGRGGGVQPNEQFFQLWPSYDAARVIRLHLKILRVPGIAERDVSRLLLLLLLLSSHTAAPAY